MPVMNVPPSELGPVPEGWVVDWHRDDTGVRLATDEEHETRYCRRPKCKRRPVMALRRTSGWWLYCADHMYGRRITNGVIEFGRRRQVFEDVEA